MTHDYSAVPVWTTGSNIAGYLPESDIAVFRDQESAREYCADEVDRLADFIADTADDAETIGLWRAIGVYADDIRANRADEYSEEFSVAIDDGRSLPTVYWVNESMIRDVFGGDTDTDEYHDIVDSFGDDDVIPGCNCAVCVTRRQDPTDVIAIDSAKRGRFVWPIIDMEGN